MEATEEVRTHGPLPGLDRQLGDLRLNHPFVRIWLSARTFNCLVNAWGRHETNSWTIWAPSLRTILNEPDARLRQIKGLGARGMHEIGQLRIFVEWNARVDDRDRMGPGRHRR